MKRQAVRCLFALFVFTLLCLPLLELQRRDTCDEEGLKDMLAYLCDAYRSGSITGNVCSPLCEQQQVRYTGCTNYQNGKKVIFANWEDRAVILKTTSERPTTSEVLGYSGEYSPPCIPSARDYIYSIRDLIYKKYNFRYNKSDRHLISLLWTGKETNEEIISVNEATNSAQQETLMRSLWSLVKQDEFLFFRLFSSNRYIPPIYGSCGHVYAVASAPPTAMLHPDSIHIARLSSYSWDERAKVALLILDVLKSAQSDFHENLHLCDIKGKNFGISAHDGMVKAIDTDMVYFESKIGLKMAGTPLCSTDGDCDIQTCMGKCNVTSGSCLQTVVNDNLEAVCRTIFSHHIKNKYTGLLSHPPADIKLHLNQLLTDCLNLKYKRVEHSAEVYSELYQLLEDNITPAS